MQSDASTGLKELPPNPDSCTVERKDRELAFDVLERLLKENDGIVSSTALRRELEGNCGVEDASPLLVELKLFDPDSAGESGAFAPSFKFHHLGRSFYSEEKFLEELSNQEKEADDASDQASANEPEDAISSRTNRQEEARLVTYVNRALQEIYSSDSNANENMFVFDVHSLRKGGSFENADLIAVHWRSEDICELIAVEVKLEFSPQVVQQALCYTRFAHRAWIAVLVETDLTRELHERHPMLFEYTISRGLGILACRRSQGRGYKVFPVHWPLRHQPDLVEENDFLERYREHFEQAGILAPKRRFPRLR